MSENPKDLRPFNTGDRKRSLLLFNCFSFFENLFYTLVNVLPHPVRILTFRLIFHTLGNNAFIDHGCYFRYPHQISIGDNACINRECAIFGSYFNKNARVTLGNNVTMGPGVKIFSASHDYHDISLPDIGEGISIGDFVWIGGGTIILPGVSIGKGAVIGAGSVVTKDIPDWSVAAGNPARVIRKRILNSERTAGELSDTPRELQK